MAIKTLQTEKDVIYYCTFTCFKWKPLFEITNFYDELYKWLNILIKKEIKVVGFVFMPNHLHCLLNVPECSDSINKILGNGKRFMAYEIVKRLKHLNQINLLNFLAKSTNSSDRKNNKKHQVFESSFDLKPCYNEPFLIQKLEYIHANPVSDKWMLADDFIDYPHSSAKFYEKNIVHPKVEITHFEDII